MHRIAYRVKMAQIDLLVHIHYFGQNFRLPPCLNVGVFLTGEWTLQKYFHLNISSAFAVILGQF